ncbi:MAG: retroviral-like aspartic protease family protein [Elusimicrobia bacterium]|nr:retroviral-like aspartic protease family protein [Elusimicrobiota bacterium]
MPFHQDAVLFFMAVALAAGRPAWADTVQLKNGNVLEGVVLRETKTGVEIDIGYGTVSVLRENIAEIRRAAGPEAAALKGRLKRSEFDAGRRVPSDARDVFERLQVLRALREKAIDARARKEKLALEQFRLEAETQSLKKDYPVLAGKLRGLDERLPAYNKAVQELNAVNAAIRSNELRLEALAKRSAEPPEDINAFLAGYDDFGRFMRSDERFSGTADKDFYDMVRAAAAEAGGAISAQTLESVKRGAHIFVDVRINGRVLASLMVDTGATFTTLSAKLADGLGLAPAADLGQVTVQVADGRQVQARRVLLDLVEVGTMRAEKVEAAVLPESDDAADGLLGMSFLRRFDVRVDGEGGRLTLRELNPDAQ